MALSCPKSSRDPLPPTLPIKEWHSLLLHCFGDTALHYGPQLHPYTLSYEERSIPSLCLDLCLNVTSTERCLLRPTIILISLLCPMVYILFFFAFFSYSCFLSSQESKLHKHVGLDCFQYQTHSRCISNIYWTIKWIFKEKTMLVYFSECVTLIFLTFSESPDV